MKRSSAWRSAALAGAVVLQAAIAVPAVSAAGTPSCTGYVALTFDDGPTSGNTTTLLSTLAAAGVRATMFNVGQNVQANPDLVRAEVAAGMWLGNHSWDHPHLTQLSAADQASQISRTQDAVKQVTGLTPNLFRPPYLETDDALRTVERQFGLTEINADVDSRDWNNTTVDQIVTNARQLQAGGVILMHDWPPNTLQAIPTIVTELRARGLCAGRISPTTGRAVAPDGTTPPSSTPATPPGGCAATYRTAGTWNGGFQGEVTVANPGTTTLNGWTVTLTLPAGTTIGSLWNGVNTGTTGAVSVAGASYNATLAPGQSTTFGFVASGSAAGITAACPGGPTAPPPTGPTPPADVLAQVNTVGRLTDQDGTVKYTWPGVYFEGRFHGTSVGIVLDDANNDYEVQIDGAAPTALLTPGRTTAWIDGLSDADHAVRVAKRTESPWAAGQFGGFVAGPGGRLLTRPAARTRQIEFIGDSWTAGYGDMSTSHDCAATGGINRNSNANQTFGALTARSLDADYQINAWSGMGMVRNYNGGNAGTDFRTYYDRALQAVDGSTWQRPASWRPQTVVVGLGINDFSTPLNAGERWADAAALAADYRAAYLAFIDKLRAQYGPDTYLVLTYPYLSNTGDLADSITQIVQRKNSQGDARVRAFYYDNTALGLDLLGCDWHPSRQDHQKIATALTGFLNTLQ
ncbi:polysaccharide deacetylase family protein [Actinoplanes sp. NPDC026623]|uniref:polysaccharide deacetylase family protein n=1 Tax=Actinoplanes sp. NPDC026623 TaxID=3155610 RepID=UPI0033F2F200